MPRKLPPIEHRFKPGVSGNPKGMPPNPVKNALKKLTGQSLNKIIKAVVKGNVEEIKRIVKDPNSSGLEVAISACFIKAIERGDYNTVEHMIQRIVGKIPDKIEVTSRNLNANLNATVDSHKVKAALLKLQEEV